MKCYYPTDKSGNRIGFKTPEACIYDTSGTNLTNKLNKLRTDVNGKAAASHGNHVPTPQTANNKIYLRNDNTWHTITPSDIGAAASSHSHSWDSITSKPSLYTTSQIDSKVDAINSNIDSINKNALEYTDWSSKWTRADGQWIKDVEYCYVRVIGHLVFIDIVANVRGGWDTTDTNTWILGKLPKPKNTGFQFTGMNTTGFTPLNFIVNMDGWLKPWYNHQKVPEGHTFCLHVCYHCN